MTQTLHPLTKAKH